MRDVLSDLLAIWRSDETAGLATVVATFHSAPRAPGAAMVVAPDGRVSGSVSGGCVEGAVYESASETVRTGKPTLERYGVSDDDAFAVGLTCGGILDVFVEPVSRATFPALADVAEDIAERRPVAVATVVDDVAGRVGQHLVIRPDDVAGRSVRTGSTPRSSTTAAVCLPPAGPRYLRTGRTGSGAARACGCSSRAMRRRPGCWCSGQSTSRPRSLGRGSSSDTG